METGDIGLLLYNGGTVCDDRFSDNSANAICREMGHLRATKWGSGSSYNLKFRNYVQSLDITLDDVECRESDWDTCRYSTTHNCVHSEDVYLVCYTNSYTGNTGVYCAVCLLRCP